MCKKIVSNLPFSPAVVAQLGFYAKRLRRELTVRRLGLIFMTLTLVIQLFATLQPPQSANATSLNDMIAGGPSSVGSILSAYDSNSRNFKNIIDYIGITRSELAATKYGSWQTKNQIVWGLTPYFSYQQGERSYHIASSSTVDFYSRPLNSWYKTNQHQNGWIGQSKQLGWFAIMQNSGNLITNEIPSVLTPVGCSGAQASAENPACVSEITESATALNMSQGLVKAASVTAQTGDQIIYTITITNSSKKTTTIAPTDNLSDILEYATVIDGGGGVLNNNILSWTSTTLKPGEQQARTFVIRIMDSIPLTAVSSSNPKSYDCIINNSFGSVINTNVARPWQKTAEGITN